MLVIFCGLCISRGSNAVYASLATSPTAVDLALQTIDDDVTMHKQRRAWQRPETEPVAMGRTEHDADHGGESEAWDIAFDLSVPRPRSPVRRTYEERVMPVAFARARGLGLGRDGGKPILNRPGHPSAGRGSLRHSSEHTSGGAPLSSVSSRRPSRARTNSAAVLTQLTDDEQSVLNLLS